MSKLQPNRTTRGTVPSKSNSAARTFVALAALLALALCAFALTGDARAQSRRAPRPAATPTPAPSPTPEAVGESESESRPRGSESGSGSAGTRDTSVVANFIIMEYDNPMMSIDYMARDDIWKEFIDRLSKSRAVSVTQEGKGSRPQARDRAKAEREAYVVLFQMEEERDSMGDASIGRVDSRNLILKTYVYAPRTGNLKFTDTIFQRPYRDTATVGGVRVPLPTSTRRVERYPNQRQLEQAARDAADRIMTRFNVAPPPDNE